ncbi:hypothetical protein [Desulfovibrio sp. UCD-KL4C]|uniref:hypothetical protein n=1 Tax=Desulfovibrio sp. UCD-KL4C TaxID=2578120 RepID=UPI0025BA0035|nr:hypothetical protein [Desulfovibrio sp. UCD-KL4C]
MRFKNIIIIVLMFAVVAMSAGGCAYINPFVSSVPEYDLDGVHELKLIMMPGDSVIFEMRNPGSGGYMFDGVTFDPKLIKLEKFKIVKPDSGMMGDFGRWQFKFNVLAIGEVPIVINIKRANDTQRDAYKIIKLNITKDGEPFFKW